MTIDVPPPGSYHLDPAASRIAFVGTHGFGGKVNGTFAVKRGAVTVDDDLTRSSVDAVIDAASIDTRNWLRDSEVRSPLFLSTNQFPTFSFVSCAVGENGGTWIVAGDLTAHGVTAPAEFAIVELALTDTGFTATAQARIDRYAHGITVARALAGRHLDLNISVTASRT